MRYILIIFFLLGAVATNAQLFRGGAIAGLNTGQIDGDKNAGFNKIGLLAGAFVETQLSEKTGLYLAVEYIGKGSKKDVDPENNNTSGKIHLDYVQVPILLSYSLRDEWALQLGISTGYLFNSRVEVDGYEMPESAYGFKNLDVCGVAGTSYDLNEKLSVNLRWAYSVMSISDHSSQSNQFNHTLSLGLLYYF